MIRFASITKTFSGVTALAGVSLTAATGTVHGVLGENGAGKSTLMRIAFGLERADHGAIEIGSSENRTSSGPRSPRDAARLGLGMVHQHFTLVPTATVTEACVLGASHGLGLVDHAAWQARIRATAAMLQWQIDPDARISSLGVGQQQRVEIIKALLSVGSVQGTASPFSARGVLILDEPTAVLTPQEVDELLPAVRRLAAAGTTVLFISHKLHEVERVCDAVTILRRGAVVHSGPVAGLSTQRMAELMVGTTVNLPSPARQPVTGAPALVITKLSERANAPAPRLTDVSFTVHQNEIVAIAGVDGNGQTALVRCVLGLDRADAVVTPGIPADQRLAGVERIGLIPDDRQHEALVMELSIERNLVLKDHHRPPFARYGWLDFAAWRAHAVDLVQRFSIRGAGPAATVASLSGGNQQKVVIARELHRQPKLIVAINPTRGLDVAASAEVLERLVSARDHGAAVLLVHHDLDELLSVADRVLVLFGGRMTDSGWPACDRAHIGRLMLGVA